MNNPPENISSNKATKIVSIKKAAVFWKEGLWVKSILKKFNTAKIKPAVRMYQPFAKAKEKPVALADKFSGLPVIFITRKHRQKAAKEINVKHRSGDYPGHGSKTA